MGSRRWMAAGALVVALVGGACGGSGTGGEEGTKVEADKPLEAVLAASDRMAEEKSSKISLLMKMDVEGQAIEITGEGAFDYTTSNGVLTMHMPEIQGVNIGTIEAVLIGNVMYQKYPPQLASAMGGKPWVKIDLNAATGVDFSQLAQAQSSNPAQVTSFTAGAESVEEVGKEDVRGVSTTHYKVVVSLSKALAETEDPALKKVIENAQKTYKSDTLPVEVWLDDDALPRRLRMLMDLSQMNVPNAEGISGGTMDMTMDLFDFGTQVTATAPPPDQVTDLTELMAKQQGR